MTISVKIIADSISPKKDRITTLQCRYPRFIHSQIMTHRVFSRNARSSRAVPITKQIKDVLTDMAMPIRWGVYQSGMQSYREHGRIITLLGKGLWIGLGVMACAVAWIMWKLRVSKQITNRILEPWSNIDVLITSTEWANFLTLRMADDAQPEIQELAGKISEALMLNVPEPLKAGQWHLPFVTPKDRETLEHKQMLMVSAARCARISYGSLGGKEPDPVKDYKLAQHLLLHGHMSPFEHQALPRIGQHANFKEWQSYRNQLQFKG